MTARHAVPTEADIRAARLLLTHLGVSPEQLVGLGPTAAAMPTFNDYIDRVSAAVSNGTRRRYGSYWNRVRLVWGERRLDDPSPLEIKQLAEGYRRTLKTNPLGYSGS